MARTKLFQRGVDFECPLAVAAIDAGVEQRIAVVHARGLPRCSHLAPHPQSTLHLPCLPSIAASIPQQKRDDISAVLASLRLDRSGCWRPTAIIPQPAWLTLQSLLLSNACQGLFAKRLWCATHSLYRGDNGWTPERTQLFCEQKGLEQKRQCWLIIRLVANWQPESFVWTRCTMHSIRLLISTTQ